MEIVNMLNYQSYRQVQKGNRGQLIGWGGHVFKDDFFGRLSYLSMSMDGRYYGCKYLQCLYLYILLGCKSVLNSMQQTVYAGFISTNTTKCKQKINKCLGNREILISWYISSHKTSTFWSTLGLPTAERLQLVCTVKVFAILQGQYFSETANELMLPPELLSLFSGLIGKGTWKPRSTVAPCLAAGWRWDVTGNQHAVLKPAFKVPEVLSTQTKFAPVFLCVCIQHLDIAAGPEVEHTAETS